MYVAALVGEAALLPCAYSAHPPARVTWFGPTGTVLRDSTMASVREEELQVWTWCLLRGVFNGVRDVYQSRDSPISGRYAVRDSILFTTRQNNSFLVNPSALKFI